MTKCPLCEHENDHNATVCSVCGATLQTTVANNKLNTDDVIEVDSSKDQSVQYTPNPQDNHDQQFDRQQYMTQQSYQQQYDPNTQYQQFGTQQRIPIKQKSKAIAFILAFLIPGAGYCYINKWGEGVAIFLICFACAALSIFTLFISLIIEVIIWICTLIDIFGKVDQYNRGELI